MFLTLVKNYTKAFFDSIGWGRRIKRVKHEFNLHGHTIYLDVFCAIDKHEFGFASSSKNINNIIGYYNKTLTKKDREWNLKQYLGVMVRCKYKGDLDGYKTIQDFIEMCILSEIGGTHTYINKMVVKSLADIRNDKLNKLLVGK
jgi:hypothetical protein